MLKKRKTLYEWLGTKLVVTLRNEENFAMKKSFRVGYSNILLISFFSLILILALYTWALNNFLGAWLNPEYKQVFLNKKYIKLQKRVDSLDNELKIRDKYLENIKTIIENNPETK